MVKFDTTPEEEVLRQKCLDRADRMEGELPDRLTLDMDLSATNANGCPLDFAKLLAFDRFNFAHDIHGIMAHIDRTSGKLMDCFLPRCAKQ